MLSLKNEPNNLSEDRFCDFSELDQDEVSNKVFIKILHTFF